MPLPRAAALAVAALLATTAASQPPPPETPPPAFGELRAVEGRTITLAVWRQEVDHVQMVAKVLVDGKPQERTMTRAVVRPALREYTVRPADLSAATAGGHAVQLRELRTYVGKGLVVVPPDGALTPAVRGTLAVDALVVLLKSPLPAPNPPAAGGTRPEPGTAATPAVTAPAPAQPPPPAAGPTPAQVANALTVIAPVLKQRNVVKPPPPVSNPELAQALPGYVIFAVPSGDPAARPNAMHDLAVVAPDGSTHVAGDDESVWHLLKDFPPVLTDADARRYVRVHLLLVEARMPYHTFGPIPPPAVTPTEAGGRTAEGEAPVTASERAKAPAAITLTVTFGKNGKRLGGKRGARGE